MKILILGGTVFLGRALVNAALNGGHQITLFNRGLSNPGLFHNLEIIISDRDSDLYALNDRKWDVVIDTSGYLPEAVRKSAEKLANKVGVYVFISTLSVYADNNQIGIDENYPLAKLTTTDIKKVNSENYGPLKVSCEQIVQQHFPDSALILRPGLIVGPHDPTDRFTYWPVRVSHSSEVLAPGRPNRQIQFIDARDLAEWTIRLIELEKYGVYNAVGPNNTLSMMEFLDSCDRMCHGETKFTWVSEKFLLDEKIEPWTNIPLWVPEIDKGNSGFFAFDNTKAIKDGLTFRNIDNIVYDTCSWAEARPSDHIWRAGIDRAKQTQLLEKWYNISEKNQNC